MSPVGDCRGTSVYRKGHVPEGSDVVVSMHIPSTLSAADRERFSYWGDISWYYKPVGMSRAEQMRVYGAEAADGIGGYVLANVWDYDPQSLKNKWISPSVTPHVFRARIKDRSAIREVRITDRFGRVYVWKAASVTSL